jgi:hypothetical protein
MDFKKYKEHKCSLKLVSTLGMLYRPIGVLPMNLVTGT